MGSELKICKQSACSKCSVSKTEHISEQHKVAAEKNRIKVSTFIQLNPKPPSSFTLPLLSLSLPSCIIFLNKRLEQSIGHAFLFPQEGLKKVREKFDGGLALIISTRPLADWIASHEASYSPASKGSLVRKRLSLYCLREMPNFSKMRTMNL